MGRLGAAGRVVAGMGIGALGALVGIKLLDDRYVDRIWRSLEQARGGGEPFKEEMVSTLPDPARRYFLHAIRPGTPLASTIHFGYSGSIKAGKGMPWMSLTVEQIAAKERGFVWKARVGKGPLVLSGVDHYLDGEGRMRIALFGLVPVVNATGPDLSRSAMGRLLVEGALLPTMLLPGPYVEIEGIDDSHFTATVGLHGETTPITLTVDQEGMVKEIVMQRWGNLTEDGSFRYIPYGVAVEKERTFDGYTVPSRLAVGWWYGTDRYEESVRLELDWAEYR